MVLFDGLKTLRVELRGSSKKKNKRASQSASVKQESCFEFDPTDSTSYAIPDSPLFQLPREIRDKIWGYVLAENLIHIGNPSKKRVTHIVCRALISDRLAHPMYPYEALDMTYWDNIRRRLPPGQAVVDYRIRDKRLRDHNFRHSFCFGESWKLANAVDNPDLPSVKEAIELAQLSLTIMRTCRAIYAETFRLLWTQNSFGFAKSVTFLSFMRPRTPLQASSIRHLAMKTEYTIQVLFGSTPGSFRARRSSDWCKALRLLPNLTSVYLTASYDLSMVETEGIWCRGELVAPVGPWDGIEIIDDLREKGTLMDFSAHVEGIEVCGGDHGDLFAMCKCNELKTDLERLLQMRVLDQREEIDFATCGVICSRLELNEQEFRDRRNSWENWKMGHDFD